MQNKPNFQKSQMDVRLNISRNYENNSNWTLGENKPNSNPIKANFRNDIMNASSVLTKDYKNERHTTYDILHTNMQNKANFKRGLVKMGNHE
jgi:hypothetical protein